VLRILLLGGFRAYDDGTPIPHFATPKVQALFSFFLLHRQRLWSRDVLTSLFWPNADQQSARNSLNTSMSRLRGALAPYERGHSYLLVRAGFVGADPEHLPSLDSIDFETAVADADALALGVADRAAAFRRADELYGGALLEGCYLDWCVTERERFHRLHLGVLETLMSISESAGECAAAIAVGRRILSVDPLREDIHQNVMRLYIRAGQRADARRQYLDLQQMLMHELGVAPTKETHALWHEVLGQPQVDRESSGSFEAVLRTLDELRDRVAAAIASHRSEPSAGGQGARDRTT
jgi:DNA-binding SARP family transcriptional activator